METVLRDAVRLLANMVRADGAPLELPMGVAARRLRLPEGIAAARVARVAEQGFIEIIGEHIRPTTSGIALAAMFSAAKTRIHKRDARPSAGPYWTYLPKEVEI
jgi:hypothetical protein